jgi:hypothetical protein
VVDGSHVSVNPVSAMCMVNGKRMNEDEDSSPVGVTSRNDVFLNLLLSSLYVILGGCCILSEICTAQLHDNCV